MKGMSNKALACHITRLEFDPQGPKCRKEKSILTNSSLHICTVEHGYTSCTHMHTHRHIHTTHTHIHEIISCYPALWKSIHIYPGGP